MVPWIQGVITKERAASAVLKIRIPYESGERLLEKGSRVSRRMTSRVHQMTRVCGL
jgi:hypothetical protein